MRKNNQKSGNLFAGFKIMRTFAPPLKNKATLKKSFGEVAEWSIAAVLKTVVPRGTRGSNPCLSAERAGQKWSANGQKATNQ